MMPQQPQMNGPGGAPPGAPPQGAAQAPPPNQVQQEPPVTIDAVLQLLRDDRMRGFRIDVETDALVEADLDTMQKNRTQFVAAVGQFLGQVGPIAQQVPQIAPMLGEMLKFAVRGYRVGKELEEIIDKGMKAAGMAMMNKPPPQPSPDEMIKLEGTKAKTAAEVQKAQTVAQIAQFDAQAKAQSSASEQHTAELQKQSDERKSAIDAALAGQAMQFEREKHAMALELHRLKQMQAATANPVASNAPKQAGA